MLRLTFILKDGNQESILLQHGENIYDMTLNERGQYNLLLSHHPREGENVCLIEKDNFKFAQKYNMHPELVEAVILDYNTLSTHEWFNVIDSRLYELDITHIQYKNVLRNYNGLIRPSEDISIDFIPKGAQ